MLGKHYISLNGQNIPNPSAVSVSYNNIENVKQSEAGTDVGNVTKLGKRTFNFTFTSTSNGKAKIMNYCMLATCTMTFDSEQIVGRLRVKSANLIKDTEYQDRTNGLWTLSVSFYEIGE